jgi:hypothetical protein
MSLDTFSHGSEDGTHDTYYDDLSATVAGGKPPLSGSSLSEYVNPLLEQQLKLEELSAEEMTQYFTTRVRDPAVVDGICEMLDGQGGRRWIQLLNSLPAGQGFSMLREEFNLDRRIVAQLLAEFTCATERTAKEALLVKPLKSSPTRPAEGQLVEGGATLLEGIRPKNSELASSVSGVGVLDKVRLDDMPLLAKLETDQQMVSSMDLEKFRISMSSWMSASSGAIAKGVDLIFRTPSTSLEAIISQLKPEELRFDCRAGSKLFATAHSSIQDMLMSDDSRRHNGSESLLKIIQTVSGVVNFQCEERTAIMLQCYQAGHPPVTEPADLEAALNKFVADYGVWARISTVDCAALYRVGIQHLMKLLFLRADMIAPLVTPIAMSHGQHPNDGVQYLQTVKQCARKLTLWPRGAGSPTIDEHPGIDYEAADPVQPVRAEDRVVPLKAPVAAQKPITCCVFSVTNESEARGTDGLIGGTDGQTGGIECRPQHDEWYDLPRKIAERTALALHAAALISG